MLVPITVNEVAHVAFNNGNLAQHPLTKLPAQFPNRLSSCVTNEAERVMFITRLSPLTKDSRCRRFRRRKRNFLLRCCCPAEPPPSSHPCERQPASQLVDWLSQPVVGSSFACSFCCGASQLLFLLLRGCFVLLTETPPQM